MKWQVSKIWSGVCWVIGGGGSIAKQFGISSDHAAETVEDFREFGDHLKPIMDDHVIGVNLASFLGDWIDVAFWGDTDTYNMYKQHFDAFGGLKVSCAPKFLQDRYTSVMYLGRNPEGGLCHDKNTLAWEHKKVEVDGVMKTINTGNSGASAVDLACQLGCTEIRLLGFDMTNDPDSGRIHFHAGYPDKNHIITNKMVKQGRTRLPREKRLSAPYHKHILAFEKIAEDAEKLGIKIINVNPDSAIPYFEKVALSDLLEIA